MDNILHNTFTDCNHDVYQQGVYIRHNAQMKADYKRLLEAARSLKGWETPSEVCANMTRSGYNLTDQMMTNWKSRGISRDGQIRTSAILGCRPHWLETGEGPMRDTLTEKTMHTNIVQGITIYKDKRGYPIISWVQAGTWREIVDSFPRGSADEYILAADAYSQHTFAVRIVGNSMEPEFKENDVVVIDPEVRPNPGDYVVARNHEEAATFKKYRPRGIVDGKEVFELVPLNEDYAVMRSDQQPIQIIGTMVEHTRFRRS